MHESFLFLISGLVILACIFCAGCTTSPSSTITEKDFVGTWGGSDESTNMAIFLYGDNTGCIRMAPVGGNTISEAQGTWETIEINNGLAALFTVRSTGALWYLALKNDKDKLLFSPNSDFKTVMTLKRFTNNENSSI